MREAEAYITSLKSIVWRQL